MRPTGSILVVAFIAVAASAQQPPEAFSRVPEWASSMQRYEARLQRLAAEVKRDAFIMGQVVQGTGELHDFQKNVAIQKALDRIGAASKRAVEDPLAPRMTIDALSTIGDLLLKAREQGSMTDTEALSREVLKLSHPIQSYLFRELDAARNERQNLAETQNKLAQLNQSLDSAMVEALASTFDFVRAGGK